MKEPRRVIVTLELDTASSLTVLKNKWVWQRAWNKAATDFKSAWDVAVQQVSVNVAKPAKKVKK